MKLFNSFTEFSNWCKEYSDKLETLVEVKEYPDYNFGTVAFMTDPFGGTYCFFNYHFNTNEITNWDVTEEMQINSHEDLRYLIFKNKIRMEAARDLDEISDLVNSEY